MAEVMHIDVKVNPAGYVLCPICGRKTAVRVNEDTVLDRFPLYCRWCKKEIIITKK